MSDAGPLTWVVGGGGLLGSTLVARTPTARRWLPSGPIPWGTPEASHRLVQETRRFLADAATRPGGGEWQIAWCAGAGVTASGPDALAAETSLLERVLEVLSDAPAAGRGGLFLASSAGGVYGGATGAPFDERTEPRAISPYGIAKLELEARVGALHRDAGVPVLVGRIANLYGPGQNLGKAQGLISQVVRAHLLGRPISMYVSLDTVRDNLYVTDAARLVDAGLARLRSESDRDGAQHVVKVLASQQGVTVGFLVAELGRIFKRRMRVVYGMATSSGYQSRDLRLRSNVWPELDRVATVPLPVGMRRIVQSLTSAAGAGKLT